MSYVFDVHGWESPNGDWIDGEPGAIDITYGVYVHVYDPETPEDERWGWVRTMEPLDDWEDWDQLVIAVYASHGIEIG